MVVRRSAAPARASRRQEGQREVVDLMIELQCESGRLASSSVVMWLTVIVLTSCRLSLVLVNKAMNRVRPFCIPVHIYKHQ